MYCVAKFKSSLFCFLALQERCFPSASYALRLVLQISQSARLEHILYDGHWARTAPWKTRELTRRQSLHRYNTPKNNSQKSYKTRVSNWHLPRSLPHTHPPPPPHARATAPTTGKGLNGNATPRRGRLTRQDPTPSRSRRHTPSRECRSRGHPSMALRGGGGGVAGAEALRRRGSCRRGHSGQGWQAGVGGSGCGGETGTGRIAVGQGHSWVRPLETRKRERTSRMTTELATLCTFDLTFSSTRARNAAGCRLSVAGVRGEENVRSCRSGRTSSFLPACFSR